MKKSLFILFSVLMLSFLACSKTDDVSQTLKQSWVFTVTTVQTVSPAMEGYPITVTTTLEQNNLTSAEADQAMADMTGSPVTMTLGGMTITTTITVTKAVKK